MSNIQIVKGDSKAFDVFVTRENPLTGLDEIVNLTGAKAWFTAKETAADLDVDAIIKKDSVANPTKVIITALAGKIRINLDPADTEGYIYRWLNYDVQIKEADATITTVVRGKIELLSESTISTT